MDDCLYIVQSGQLNLYLVDKVWIKVRNAGLSNPRTRILGFFRASPFFRSVLTAPERPEGSDLFFTEVSGEISELFRSTPIVCEVISGPHLLQILNL